MNVDLRRSDRDGDMENQVLVVVLKENLSANEICALIGEIQHTPGVALVRTFERIVADALPLSEDA